MKMQVSLSATALGGAASTIGAYILKNVYGWEFDEAMQGACQTVITFVVVLVAKIIELILAKYKINLDEGESK